MNSTPQSELFSMLNLECTKKNVRCLCPRCGAFHKVQMLWTGRGIPRKYCPLCRPVIAVYDDTVCHDAPNPYSPAQNKKTGQQ
ncbi:uncharacterized protein Dvar_10510 [Desulfosarcina variabilis str. Montpellier]